LRGEYGIALGGGRMASLFASGWIGEHGDNGALAGLRIYFGQHDKSLIDRHRQGDPFVFLDVAFTKYRYEVCTKNPERGNREGLRCG
jgi:hypothetical protein